MSEARDVIACTIEQSICCGDGPGYAAGRVLSALSDAGYVILPREPTDAMVIAAAETSQSFMARIDTAEDDYAYAILCAALSAGEEE